MKLEKILLPIFLMTFCILPKTFAAAKVSKPLWVLKDESELSLSFINGNTKSDYVSGRQLNTFEWLKNTFKLEGKYGRARYNDIEYSKTWSLNLRYERELNPNLILFAAQILESDKYAGYWKRHNSDLGAKHYLIKDNESYWNIEAGYRKSVETRLVEVRRFDYLRFYTEANLGFSVGSSAKFTLEYLPNLTEKAAYQINGEPSLTTMISTIMYLKVGYTFKYNHVPPIDVHNKLDTAFTTALIAKF